MRNIKKLLSLFLFTVTVIQAESNFYLDDFQFNQYHLFAPEPCHPFSVIISGDAVGKAHFKKWYLDDQDIQYRTINITGFYTFYSNCEDQLAFNLGYTKTNLAWSDNPFSAEDVFHTISLSLDALTTRWCGWLWEGQAIVNLDAHHPDFDTYATYDFILYGRYEFSPSCHLYTGCIAQTGLRINRLYPIIGFDWIPACDWKISVVYPVNLSVVYSLNQNWKVALASRVFDHRHRLGKSEPLTRGIWAYRAYGGEFAIRYEFFPAVKANFHLGSTFKTKLSYANQHNRFKRHFRIKDALYFGGEIQFNF